MPNNENYHARNAAFVADVQRHLGISPDGRAGAATNESWKAHVDASSSPFPRGNTADITEFFGDPGRPGDLHRPDYLERFTLPYPMRLAWHPATIVTSQYAHRMVVPSLAAILSDMLDHYGLYEIICRGLDLLGGIYYARTMRGGSEPSRHSWGIAIDIDPINNRNRARWPDEATMPRAVIQIFESHGWTSYARTKGRDAMHFEATSR